MYYIATGLSPTLHVKDLICNKKRELPLGSILIQNFKVSKCIETGWFERFPGDIT